MLAVHEVFTKCWLGKFYQVFTKRCLGRFYQMFTKCCLGRFYQRRAVWGRFYQVFTKCCLGRFYQRSAGWGRFHEVLVRADLTKCRLWQISPSVGWGRDLTTCLVSLRRNIMHLCDTHCELSTRNQCSHTLTSKRQAPTTCNNI